MKKLLIFGLLSLTLILPIVSSFEIELDDNCILDRYLERVLIDNQNEIHGLLDIGFSCEEFGGITLTYIEEGNLSFKENTLDKHFNIENIRENKYKIFWNQSLRKKEGYDQTAFFELGYIINIEKPEKSFINKLFDDYSINFFAHSNVESKYMRINVLLNEEKYRITSYSGNAKPLYHGAPDYGDISFEPNSENTIKGRVNFENRKFVDILRPLFFAFIGSFIGFILQRFLTCEKMKRFIRHNFWKIFITKVWKIYTIGFVYGIIILTLIYPQIKETIFNFNISFCIFLFYFFIGLTLVFLYKSYKK